MLLTLLSKLPLWALYRLSDITYLLVYYVARYRISITRKNLQKAFPEFNEKQRKVIEKKYYRSFIDSLFETIFAYSMSQEEVVRRLHFESFDIIHEQLKRSDSVILLTAHLGNLEWLLHATQSKLKVPIDPVYRPAHNQLVNRFIFAVRSKRGGTPIPYKRMAKDFLLRQDIPRCIAIPADLRPRSRERTIEVDFLNQKTRFFFNVERLVTRYKLPVVFICMHRTSRGHYNVVSTLISSGNTKTTSQEKITEQYARLVEKQIYTQPESWLWSHRRWKN